MNQTNDVSQLQEQFGEAIQTGDLDKFDELVSDAFVDHDPAPNQPPGAEGLKLFFGEMRTAFPDLRVSPVHVVQTKDELAIAYLLEGTQTGPFMGHSPTGMKVRIRGMQIGRFENGKMVERWGSSDELGMLKQLGISTIPA